MPTFVNNTDAVDIMMDEPFFHLQNWTTDYIATNEKARSETRHKKSELL